MSNMILTGNDCPACADLRRALDSLVDVGIEVTWHNVQENGMVETDRPVRSVPTLVRDNKVVAQGLDNILEELI